MADDDGSAMFSVIMTIGEFNEKLVQRAIKSLASQTLGDFELVLQARTTAVVDFVSFLCDEHNIMFVGQVDASLRTRTERFNEAVKNARGGWCAILDSDDVLHPNALFRVAQCLAKYPLHDYFRTSHIGFYEKIWATQVNLAMPLAQTCANLQHSFMQRHFWGFRNSRERWPKLLLGSPYAVEDYWFFCILAMNSKAVLHIPDILYGWCKWEGQWTQINKGESALMCADMRARMHRFNKQQSAGFFFADNMMAMRLMKCYTEMERDIISHPQ